MRISDWSSDVCSSDLLDIESADFDNGVFVFANAGGDVVNQGSIVAGSGGTVALLGNEAVNAAGGSIVAPRGSVIMGSGDRVTLDFEGDGLTQVTVEGQLVDGLVRKIGRASCREVCQYV